MQKSFWEKDPARQEIITKKLIPNKRNFDFFATYYNLMDCKGLSFQFQENIEFKSEKLFIKKNLKN
jgi:hypothetical protein